MARWSGKIGFVETVETKPSIWVEQVIERHYKGDFTKVYGKVQNSSSVNGNVDISNQISFVADPYAVHNFLSIRYIEYMGVKWSVSGVDASQRPRLVVTIGGVYHAEQG